jgi:outer membrane protein assembly factor BamB
MMHQLQKFRRKYCFQLFALILLCPLMVTLFSACGSSWPPKCEAVYPANLYPSFQILNGIAYLYSSYSNSLYAVRTGDGAVQWHYNIQEDLFSEKVADGLVYLETNQYNIVVLRASDGKLLWQKSEQDSIQLMVASDGIVYIGTNEHLVALSGSDGKLLWQHSIGNPSSTTNTSSASGMYLSKITESNGIVYSLTSQENVIALRASDGAFLWQYLTHAQPPSFGLEQSDIFSVEDNTLYVQTDHIYALQAASGHLLWQFPGTREPTLPFFLPVIITQGTVYVMNNSIYALRSDNGKLLWQFPPKTLPLSRITIYFSEYVGKLILMNGVLYAGAAGSLSDTFTLDKLQNHIIAVRASDGKLLWQYRNPSTQSGSMSISLAASDNLAYFLPFMQPRRPLHTLEAFDARNGKFQWQRNLHSVQLLVNGDSLYASAGGVTGSECYSAANTYIDKLRLSDGTQLWHFEAGDVSSPSL